MSNLWVFATLALWVLLLLLGSVTLGVLRRVVGVLEQVEGRWASDSVTDGLGPGEQVGSFEVLDQHGALFTEQDLQDKFSMMLFVDNGCGPCEDLVADIQAAAGSWEPPVEVYVVSDDSTEGRQLTADLDLRRLFQRHDHAARAFRATFFPVAFLIDDQGSVIARTNPNTLDQLKRFLHLEGGDHRLSLNGSVSSPRRGGEA